MKIVEIVAYYPVYIEKFYEASPGMETRSYGEQMHALNDDSAGWSDFWQRALEPLGYAVSKIILNAAPLQKAWARENGFASLADNFDRDAIGLEQVKAIKPDIILYNHYDEALLSAIKKEVPSVRLVLCWVGSAIPKSGVWKDIDVILSCAPETIEYFRTAGHKNSFHLNHGFDPVINERLLKMGPAVKRYGLSFVGQLTRQNEFHLYRDALLERLIKIVDMSIFSPSVDSYSFADDIDFIVRKYSFKLMNALKKAGISKDALAKIPRIGKAALWETPPFELVNPALKKYIRPGVFGIQMYRILQESKLTLNIHADSSPRYASNMRLFEATGVGCCLLTDWRDNLAEMFEPEREVVTYKTPEECAERAKWLADNPAERDKIAAAGMKRCLKDHTFAVRARTLDGLIKEAMK